MSFGNRPNHPFTEEPANYGNSKRAEMQDFIDQARKNGVALLQAGACQFCDAQYQRGIFDCIDHYNHALEPLDPRDPAAHILRFLSVDAHALQHPEIHGRWSNHFHLTRLFLIIEKGQRWDYKKSPMLSGYLNEYKLARPNEVLDVPAVFKRGATTSKDVASAQTATECAALIRKWAEEVYEAWKPNYVTIADIANGFMFRCGD